MKHIITITPITHTHRTIQIILKKKKERERRKEKKTIKK